MAKTVKGRIIKAGGWGLVRRLIKPLPIVGPMFSASLIAYEVKKKGLVRGAVHVGLDLTPLVGTVKNVVEIFTGDLIPDKPLKGPRLNHPAEVKQITTDV
jgi:hypothetical protein